MTGLMGATGAGGAAAAGFDPGKIGAGGMTGLTGAGPGAGMTGGGGPALAVPTGSTGAGGPSLRGGAGLSCEPEGTGDGGGVAIDLTGVVVGGTIVVVEGETRGGAATMEDFFLAKRASLAASPTIAAAAPATAAPATAEGRGGTTGGSIFCVPDAAMIEVLAGGVEGGT